jgi:SprB repeat
MSKPILAAKIFFFFFIFQFLSSNIYSQSQSVRVTLVPYEIRGRGDVGNENPDWRFLLSFQGVTRQDCIGVDNVPQDEWIGVPDDQRVFVINQSVSDFFTQPVRIGLDAWDEDGCGGNCEYKATTGCFESSDDAHCGPSEQHIFLSNFIPGDPGIATNTLQLGYCGDYSIKYKVSYAPPAPATPSVKIDNQPASETFLCGNNIIELSTSNAINPFFQAFVDYTWQYHISGETNVFFDPNPSYCGNIQGMCDGGGGGPIFQIAPSQQEKSGEASLLPGDVVVPPCCFESPFIIREEPIWRTISGTTNATMSGGNKSFDIRSLEGLKDITQNKTVRFRVVAVANHMTGDFSESSTDINVSPLPPAMGAHTTTLSCPNGSDGSIVVAGVSGGVNSYKYNLRPGHGNNGPCDPYNENPPCFTGIKSHTASNSEPPNITSVPPGNYTLWLVNFGANSNSGSCFATRDVTVSAHSTLALGTISKQDISCHGTSSGRITLSATGGKSPYIFSATNQSNNSTGNFANVAAGNYNVSVTDVCLQSIPGSTNGNVVIKQPAKISESIFNPENATCTSLGNGKFTSVVSESSGAFDVPVSSTYSFRFYKDNLLYDSHDSNTPEWSMQNLPVSNQYQLRVTEEGGAECNGYTKTFAIAAPAALTATSSQLQIVSCYGGSNGKVTLSGQGGSGQYIFKMTKTPGDTTFNTDGAFTTLPSGAYTLVVQNGLEGCTDHSIHHSPITINQPDRINADLTKTNISCNGLQDGKIEAVVSGGTPGYTTIWQQLIGSSWSDLSQQGDILTDRLEGTYRLKMLDSKNCPDSSAMVNIIEPPVLQITGVTVDDINCFNEKGHVEVVSTGGTGAYSYSYSLAAAPFTSFNSLTPLDVGSYTVKVEDERHCSYTQPGNYVITTPPIPLDFTYQQQDYNGYHISCFGGSNGSITLAATGGNGAAYSGYTYAKDGGTFQPQNKLEQFNAGTHVISVRDNRGCVISKDVTFTQTDALLSISLKNKKDIDCYGDKTGILELEADGGLSPYRFHLDQGTDQVPTVFNGLGDKTYHATVLDKNNCDASADYTVNLLNPKIEIGATIKDVNCFEGTDGAVTLSISAGVSPFRYTWKDQQSTTNVLAGVKTGEYTTQVTDQAGCKQESTFTVGQPAKPLETKVAVVPVCTGRTNGVITIMPVGGTSPYQYSINNGQTYQNNAVFNTVGVGDYDIKVQDRNACVTVASASIIQRNDLPLPDFIVATKQYALDTLLIREISRPQPDSIHWTFDSKATIVKKNQWSPEIVFKEPGEYTITMTGYFQACDYSAKRTLLLNPYDPEATEVKTPGWKSIESVVLNPNPTTGEFEVTIKLSKKYKLSLSLYDVLGISHYNKSWESVQAASEKITLPDLAPGVYVLRAVTPSEARDIRVVINK